MSSRNSLVLILEMYKRLALRMKNKLKTKKSNPLQNKQNVMQKRREDVGKERKSLYQVKKNREFKGRRKLSRKSLKEMSITKRKISKERSSYITKLLNLIQTNFYFTQTKRQYILNKRNLISQYNSVTSLLQRLKKDHMISLNSQKLLLVKLRLLRRMVNSKKHLIHTHKLYLKIMIQQLKIQ